VHAACQQAMTSCSCMHVCSTMRPVTAVHSNASVRVGMPVSMAGRVSQLRLYMTL
jgi:hypothetical protein